MYPCGTFKKDDEYAMNAKIMAAIAATSNMISETVNLLFLTLTRIIP